MRLLDITYEPLRYIVANMRERDREEVFATMHHFDPNNPEGLSEDEIFTQATLYSLTANGIGWIAAHEGEPVACLGMSMLWPGVAIVGMVATDSFEKVGRPLTRFVRKSMIPCMCDAGIHRAHCWSMSGHTKAHQWLRALGATEEAIVPGYGRDGQDFHLFAWVKGRDF